MSKTLILYRWRIRSEVTGRMTTTRHLMTEADALAHHPGAERLESTREVRHVPDDPEALSTSAWQRWHPPSEGC